MGSKILSRDHRTEISKRKIKQRVSFVCGCVCLSDAYIPSCFQANVDFTEERLLEVIERKTKSEEKGIYVHENV
jgi:hypothetical protein